jgi:hypothetical protein
VSGAPLGAEQAGEVGHVGRGRVVEQVAVGPVLDHVTVGVEPVVVDLAAEDVPADPPLGVVPTLHEVGVSGHEVVEVGHLERRVVERGAASAEEEQGVVVDVAVASIAAQERPERGALVELNLVGREQAEVLLVPRFTRAVVDDVENAVTEPLDVRRSRFQAQRRARARLSDGVVGNGAGSHRQPPDSSSSGHYLDLEAVRIGGAHDPSSTWSIEIDDAGEVVAGSELVEVGHGVCFEGEADETGFGAEMADVHKAFVIGAAHVQRVVGSLRDVHAEGLEERLHHVEVWHVEADKRDVVDLDAHDGQSPGEW